METGAVPPGLDAGKAGFLELLQGLVEVVHSHVPQVVEALPAAVEILTAAKEDEAWRPLSVVQALPHLGTEGAGALTVKRLPLGTASTPT